MPAQIYNQNDLIAMLKWQFDMGIDESLLDNPDGVSQPVQMDEFLALTGGSVNLNNSAVPQEALKMVLKKIIQ